MQSIYPEEYQQLLETKVTTFKKNLADQTLDPLPEIDIFTSEHSHYRMRAEFKIWHEGDNSYYAMHNPKTKQVYTLNDFPVASKPINRLMPVLLEKINSTAQLRKRLFQVEFLSTLSGETVISLIYHRALDSEWESIARQLEQDLNIHIIGRSRKQKLVLSQDFVTETLTVNDTQYHYQQIENSFTQPNAKVCEKMLTWAVNNCCAHNDLLELYCGNGNFTIPLSSKFQHVLATEISKPSVRSALHNLQQNTIDNVEIIRMSSEELVAAIEKQRPFRRLANIDIDSYQFSTVFVDPPRAGLDPATLSLIQHFDHIIYVSCNPETLCKNLNILNDKYSIDHLAAFDQFPYTHHLEVGVMLSKK